MFTENSYGVLTLNSTVVAWVTLPQTEAYYANGSSGLGGFYPENPQGMVEDALNLVDPLVDFGQFDLDSDGFIDAISIIHSGFGAETGGGGGFWICPHSPARRMAPRVCRNQYHTRQKYHSHCNLGHRKMTCSPRRR